MVVPKESTRRPALERAPHGAAVADLCIQGQAAGAANATRSNVVHPKRLATCVQLTERRCGKSRWSADGDDVYSSNSHPYKRDCGRSRKQAGETSRNTERSGSRASSGSPSPTDDSSMTSTLRAI